MFRKIIIAAFLIVISGVLARAQEKPVLVVHPFTVASGVNFPSDMSELQIQAVDELKSKDGSQFDIVSKPPANESHVYILTGK